MNRWIVHVPASIAKMFRLENSRLWVSEPTTILKYLRGKHTYQYWASHGNRCTTETNDEIEQLLVWTFVF